MSGTVGRAAGLAALLREHVETPELVKPDTRAEAGEIIAEIDQKLRDLHKVRAELVAATRKFDDARDQRIDAWLRERGRR
jgi:hypothetical protein